MLEAGSIEIWKDIPDYEGLYKCSSFGRVKSLYYGKQRILKPARRNGYYFVLLSKKGIKKMFDIHRLVYQAFNGGLIYGLEIDHNNNNKLDNNHINLIQRTRRSNSSKDQWRHIRASKYIGVHRARNKWKAQIRIKGKKTYLGTFDKEEDAAKAYKEALWKIQV